MRRVGFLFLLGLPLSLGAAELCFAQQNPLGFGPETRRWQIDTESGQFWAVGGNRDFRHRGSNRGNAPRVPISLPEGRVLKSEEAKTISRIIKDDFLVNDDTTGGCDQKSPAVAMDPLGTFVICWRDNRNGDDGDIYAQRYNSSGDTLGANFRVNDDVGTSRQWIPSVSMDTSVNHIICWKDTRRGGWSIYAQRYDSSNHPQGGNFKIKVDNDNIFRQQWNSSVSMDASGNFVICWEDNYCWDDSTGNDIYAQRYNNLGEPLGDNFRVDDDIGVRVQENPRVAMSGNGNFIIAYRDERNWQTNRWDIYCQRYNSFAYPQGANHRVNDDSGAYEQTHPSVSMDRFGKSIICWQDKRNGDWDIYAQLFNTSGDTVKGNFRVNDDTGTSRQYSPSVAIDVDGDFVICWQDGRNGDWDIYAQKYHSDGTSWGTNYLVNQRPDVSNPDQFSPAVTLNNDQIIFTWVDERNGDRDIYAKVVTWDWEKVNEQSDVELPKYFALFQNYPNPFNSTTAISYRLPAVSHQRSAVSLKIYNVLGQEVRTLVDREQPAGSYRVLWDGRDNSGKDVSSGIYFCRLKVIGDRLKVTKSKKMVLIR